jgi:tetratricopeptide (TPR) repeat protein
MVLSADLKIKLIDYMIALGHADRRIRLNITKELESRYWNNGCTLCKANDAFQIALCLRTGFSLSYNLEESNVWLERSGHTTQDLMFEINHGRGMTLHVYKEERIRNLQEEYLTPVYYAHEYRTDPNMKLKQVQLESEKEINAVGDVFGHTHELTIILTRIHATLLWEQGLYEEAAEQQKSLLTLLSVESQSVTRLKVSSDLSMTYSAQGHYREARRIREEIVEELNQALGPEHIFTLTAMNNLAHTQINLRHWKQAEDLLLQVIAMKQLKLGDEHSSTLAAKCNLAAVYYNQSRWDEAETLQSEILQAKKRALGGSHESTLYSMVSLAAIKSKRGNTEDAEALETKVVDLRKSLLGPRHPDTLVAMSNLALTYGQKKQGSREEEMLTQVHEGRIATLGPHHRDTIATLAELARNYQSQGRLDEAEVLQAQVLRSRSLTLGEKDYYTLASRTNLAWVFVDQRKWPQAEAMQLQTIALAEEGYGKFDLVVLRCMSSLASMYKVHNRLEESLSLYTKVLEARSESLDEGHPDRLKSRRDVETVRNMLATQRLHCQG